MRIYRSRFTFFLEPRVSRPDALCRLNPGTRRAAGRRPCWRTGAHTQAGLARAGRVSRPPRPDSPPSGCRCPRRAGQWCGAERARSGGLSKLASGASLQALGPLLGKEACGRGGPRVTGERVLWARECPTGAPAAACSGGAKFTFIGAATLRTELSGLGQRHALCEDGAPGSSPLRRQKRGLRGPCRAWRGLRSSHATAD